MNIVFKQFKIATIILLVFTFITGVVYPWIITEIAQYFFPNQANGSFIIQNGKNLGSTLIGQNFNSPKYFWGRPSATSIFPYNAMSSKGSDLSPVNPDFIAIVNKRVEILQKAHGTNHKIPIDLVEASGSGIDPHISLAAAYYQIHRVAKARGLTDEKVQKLVDAYVEDRQFWILGEPRVNVLKLNLALDSLLHSSLNRVSQENTQNYNGPQKSDQ